MDNVVESAIISAIVSVIVGGFGAALAYLRWRRDVKIQLGRIHEEVTQELIRQRIEPYTDLMHKLEQMSGLYEQKVKANREIVTDWAEVFQQAIYGSVGLLAANITRELVVNARSGCKAYLDYKITYEELRLRIWGIHQGLRSDLGLPQPNWPSEIELRRENKLAYDADFINELVRKTAIHLGYELYKKPNLAFQLDSDHLFFAVIFDMDGLMLDTEYIEREAWRDAATQLGVGDRLTDELYSQVIGQRQADSELVFRKMFGDRYFEIRKLKEASYEKCYEKYVAEKDLPIKPGLLALLDWLDAKNLPRAVASSSNRKTIMNRLTHAGILNRFDLIVSAGDEEVKHGKPEPDIFQVAADKLNIEQSDRKHCLVIEDSPNGIRAAQRAGMIPIMVPDLVQPSAEIRGLYHREFPSLKNVQEWLETLKTVKIRS